MGYHRVIEDEKLRELLDRAWEEDCHCNRCEVWAGWTPEAVDAAIKASTTESFLYDVEEALREILDSSKRDPIDEVAWVEVVRFHQRVRDRLGWEVT